MSAAAYLLQPAKYPTTRGAGAGLVAGAAAAVMAQSRTTVMTRRDGIMSFSSSGDDEMSILGECPMLSASKRATCVAVVAWAEVSFSKPDIFGHFRTFRVVRGAWCWCVTRVG